MIETSLKFKKYEDPGQVLSRCLLDKISSSKLFGHNPNEKSFSSKRLSASTLSFEDKESLAGIGTETPHSVL